MELELHNKINVLGWPLKNVGDEKFFGYVVAMGVCPRDLESSDAYVEEGGLFSYADFEYNCNVIRYAMPDDPTLHRKLSTMLLGNMDGVSNGQGMYCKVWIKKNADGYSVDLP